MIEIGGEIRVRGRNPTGDKWRIGIETPSSGDWSILRKVELERHALATSGDYQNYIESGGKRLPHVIDPRTGTPVGHKLASVTVLADECIHADALATALFVMGPEDGFSFASSNNLAAVFVVSEEEVMATKTLATKTFPEMATH